MTETSQEKEKSIGSSSTQVWGAHLTSLTAWFGGFKDPQDPISLSLSLFLSPTLTLFSDSKDGQGGCQQSEGPMPFQAQVRWQCDPTQVSLPLIDSSYSLEESISAPGYSYIPITLFYVFFFFCFLKTLIIDRSYAEYLLLVYYLLAPTRK